MAGFGTKTSRAAAALGAYVDEKFDNAIAMAEAMANEERAENADNARQQEQYRANNQRWIDAGRPDDGSMPTIGSTTASGGGGAGNPNTGEFTQLYMLQAEFGKATAANQVANGIIKGINEDQKDASRVK